MQASSRTDIRVMFNSLGAYASQNHLHLHVLYLEGIGFCRVRQHRHCDGTDKDIRLPVEIAGSSQIKSKGKNKNNSRSNHNFEYVDQYPIKSFRFPFNSIQGMRTSNIEHAAGVWLLIEILQFENIAHNVVIAHDAIHVIPRKNQIKNTVVKFAVIEAAGIFIILRSIPSAFEWLQ